MILKIFIIQPNKNIFYNTTSKYCKLIKKKLKLPNPKKILYERNVTKSNPKRTFG